MDRGSKTGIPGTHIDTVFRSWYNETTKNARKESEKNSTKRSTNQITTRNQYRQFLRLRDENKKRTQQTNFSLEGFRLASFVISLYGTTGLCEYRYSPDMNQCIVWVPLSRHVMAYRRFLVHHLSSQGGGKLHKDALS